MKKVVVTKSHFLNIFLAAAFAVVSILGMSVIALRFGTTPKPRPKTLSATPVSVKISSQSASPKDNTIATPSAAINRVPLTDVGIPILMYHYVGNNPNPKDHQRDTLSITPDKFETQMRWLSINGYTPVTLDSLFGIFYKLTPRPRKPVVLTFDDGYVDFYYNAFPILNSFNFHAVSFIPTGLIGKPAYMTWDQIKQIQTSGLVDFEAHTINHYDLTTLPYPKIIEELKQSKITLEQQIGRPVNFIAYPFGSSNSLVWRAALDSGFVGGVGTWFGKAAGPGINMPRIRIVGQISLEEFARKL